MKTELAAVSIVAVILAIVSVSPAFSQGQDTFPEGTGRDTLFLACSQCHSIGKIVNATLTADDWQFIVYDMVSRGSPVHADDLDELTSYLQENFATDK